MKTALLALVLAALPACGRMFNDATDVPITVPVPMSAEFTVDDVPVGRADHHRLYVEGRHDHVITARVGDSVVGTCYVHATVQTRYVIGDVLLLELLFPIVLDATSNDWAVVEPTTCIFR